MTYPGTNSGYGPTSPRASGQASADRYYYDQSPVTSDRSDGDLKAEAVDRLRANTFTAGSTLNVNVKAGVVVLEGDVPSSVAKRAAGDDVWDIVGVVDVSNQLRVVSV